MVLGRGPEPWVKGRNLDLGPWVSFIGLGSLCAQLFSSDILFPWF